MDKYLRLGIRDFRFAELGLWIAHFGFESFGFWNFGFAEFGFWNVDFGFESFGFWNF